MLLEEPMDRATCTNAISRYASQAAILAACLTLVASESAAQAEAAKSSTAVDTAAVNALRRMGAYLRNLQRFGVSGDHGS